MLLYTIMAEKRIGKSKSDGGRSHRQAPTHFDEDGNALWDSVTKDITPLKAKTPGARNMGLPQKISVVAPKNGGKGTDTKMIGLQVDVSLKPAHTSKKTSQAGSQMSAQQKKRHIAGDIPFEGKIDLHGKTLESAFRSLKSFIQRAYTAQKRSLLVITGKGRTRQDGMTIRQSLPLWLQNDTSLAPLILSLTLAQPKDGGDGAWYILLRRQKHIPK